MESKIVVVPRGNIFTNYLGNMYKTSAKIGCAYGISCSKEIDCLNFHPEGELAVFQQKAWDRESIKNKLSSVSGQMEKKKPVSDERLLSFVDQIVLGTELKPKRDLDYVRNQPKKPTTHLFDHKNPKSTVPKKEEKIVPSKEDQIMKLEQENKQLLNLINASAQIKQTRS